MCNGIRKKIKTEENGSILVLSLIVVLLLSLLGLSALSKSAGALKTSQFMKECKIAFYDAEAGEQYALLKINEQLSNGTIALGDTVINFSLGNTPSGFNFTLPTQMTMVDVGGVDYIFSVKGEGPQNSSKTIEVLVRPKTLVDYGGFGDDWFDIRNSGGAYSWDSDDGPLPPHSSFPAASTGDADVASNGEVILKNSASVDGDVVLGQDSSGTDATSEINAGSSLSGDVVDIDRIDPDPLGIIGGDLEVIFNSVIASNDNASSTAISGTTLVAPKNVPVTLTAGNYYITGTDFKNASELIIDTSLGEVNIYLDGPFETKESSTITVIDALGNPGVPSDFSIYSRSTDDIIFKHNSDFIGTIYAPYAEVDMRNSSDVFGLIWADTALIHNSGLYVYDSALKDKWLSKTVNAFAWREIKGQ